MLTESDGSSVGAIGAKRVSSKALFHVDNDYSAALRSRIGTHGTHDARA